MRTNPTIPHSDPIALATELNGCAVLSLMMLTVNCYESLWCFILDLKVLIVIKLPRFRVRVSGIF